MFDSLEPWQKDEMEVQLSSFLAWVYRHNPDFSTALTREELTTTWLTALKHPAWIEARIQQRDLPFLAEVNEYLEAYYAHAHLFEEAVTPTWKPTTLSSPSVPSPDRITPKQLKYLRYLAQQHDRTIPHLETLSKREASQRIFELTH